MYKTFTALGVVVALVSTVFVKLIQLEPEPRGNVVIAEKSDVIKGGQMAVVVPANLSNTQHQLLNDAYKIAREDGHKNPELVQGVILQETRAGAMSVYKVAGNPGDLYYGIGQIKIGAARDVMSAFPKLWAKYKFHTRTDDELKANLILNQLFNIEITSKYLKLLQTRYGYSGRELVNAYNRGPTGVKAVDNQFHYARGAESKLAAFKRGP